MSESTKEIINKFSESMERSFIHSISSNNIFQKMEAEKKIKFSKYSVVIPWYLKPFRNLIINIAYASFKDGLSDGCTDTVTFKRPTPYKAKVDE